MLKAHDLPQNIHVFDGPVGTCQNKIPNPYPFTLKSCLWTTVPGKQDGAKLPAGPAIPAVKNETGEQIPLCPFLPFVC